MTNALSSSFLTVTPSLLAILGKFHAGKEDRPPVGSPGSEEIPPYVYFLDFFHLLGAKRRHTGPSTPAFVLAIFLIAMTKYLRGELREGEGYLSWFIGSESLAHLVRQTCSQSSR